jgi:hypothetical protein
MATWLRLAPLLALLTPLAANAQFPLIRQWPDTAFPCNTTLQACIDGSFADDTVEVVTDGPIDEAILIEKTMSLVASVGHQPTFAAGRDIVARSPGGDRYFWIEGFTLPSGSIYVNNFGVGALGATVRNNRCETIEVRADTGGPLFFDVRGNEVAPVFGQLDGIAVEAAEAYGDGEIARNSVTVSSLSGTTGISVLVEYGSMDVDVVANRVQGALYQTGIEVLALGFTQSFHARIVNNLVSGATAQGWGITSQGQGGGDGQIDLEVLNNTVAGNTNGIGVNAFDTVVANNVVAGNQSFGYTFAFGGGATHVDRNNLAFGNGDDFFVYKPHPSTQFADPLFGDTVSYRPTRHSPVVDAADDTLLPAGFDTDLDGNPRRLGGLDIGAYEVPEPSAGPAATFAIAALTALRGARRTPDPRDE